MLKAYVVIAMRRQDRPGQSVIGYRALTVAAANMDEAVGRGMRSMSDADPDGEYSQPSAIPVTLENLRSLGVNLCAPAPGESGAVNGEG